MGVSAGPSEVYRGHLPAFARGLSQRFRWFRTPQSPSIAFGSLFNLALSGSVLKFRGSQYPVVAMNSLVDQPDVLTAVSSRLRILGSRRNRQDLGRSCWPFTRELIQVGQSCHCDCGNGRLRQMAFSLGAGRA